jgi:hypothetical protein
MDEYVYQENNCLGESICEEIIELYNESIRENRKYLNVSFHNKEGSPWFNIKTMLKKLLINAMIKYREKTTLYNNEGNIIHRVSLDPLCENLPINLHFFTLKAYNKDYNDESSYYYNSFMKDDYYPYFNYIIYLNTIEGGETEISNVYKIKPERGKIIIFPVSWTYFHKENKIETNECKYVIKGIVYAYRKRLL